MSPEQTTQVLSLIDAAWPSHKWTRETRLLVSRLIAPLSPDDCRAGIMALIRTHKFPPSIAELLEACEPRAQKSGYEAWGEVSLEVRRIGRGGAPSFADPVVARAVELFGWAAICDSRNEEADRAHFCRLYESLAKGAEVTGTGKQLAGGRVLALAAKVGEAINGNR